MYFLALFTLIIGSLMLGAILQYYYSYKKIISAKLKFQSDSDKKERELKRKVFELQMLHSLGERVGYSLDIRQILEVIIDSLPGLVDFATVSYIINLPDHQVLLKTKVAQPVSHLYLTSVTEKILPAFSAMTGKEIPQSLVEESISGIALDDLSILPIGSFFNLPVVISEKAVGMISVTSPKIGLYGDEETLILYTILAQVSDAASKLTNVLENEKRKLSAMISSLTDGVVMVDPKLSLIVSNPAAFKLLSLPDSAELLDVLSIIQPKANLKEAIDAAISNQRITNFDEFELVNSAVQISVEPVKDKFNYLIGALIIIHDVTSQHQIERLKEDFTAMMVHELRTPLTTVTYSTDMMLSDLNKLSKDQLAKNLQIIQSTTKDMLSLVSDLLDVAKIEAGKFQIHKENSDLTALLRDKIELFTPQADKKGLHLLGNINQNLPPFDFDKIRIGQVVSNLLSNAIKYTDSGMVELKAVKDSGNSIKVSVTDTGDGIKPPDLPKLFSKFEQLGKGKSGEREGSGLGLIISKGIIEAHRGTLWAASAGLGKGATFSFTLPTS